MQNETQEPGTLGKNVQNKQLPNRKSPEFDTTINKIITDLHLTEAEFQETTKLHGRKEPVPLTFSKEEVSNFTPETVKASYENFLRNEGQVNYAMNWYKTSIETAEKEGVLSDIRYSGDTPDKSFAWIDGRKKRWGEDSAMRKLYGVLENNPSLIFSLPLIGRDEKVSNLERQASYNKLSTLVWGITQETLAPELVFTASGELAIVRQKTEEMLYNYFTYAHAKMILTSLAPSLESDLDDIDKRTMIARQGDDQDTFGRINVIKVQSSGTFDEQTYIENLTTMGHELLHGITNEQIGLQKVKPGYLSRVHRDTLEPDEEGRELNKANLGFVLSECISIYFEKALQQQMQTSAQRTLFSEQIDTWAKERQNMFEEYNTLYFTEPLPDAEKLVNEMDQYPTVMHLKGYGYYENSRAEIIKKINDDRENPHRVTIFNHTLGFQLIKRLQESGWQFADIKEFMEKARNSINGRIWESIPISRDPDSDYAREMEKITLLKPSRTMDTASSL